MNRLGTTVACLLMLFPAAAGWAAEVQLAFVDTSRVLEEAPQAQRAHQKLKAEFAGRDAELAESQRQLEELSGRLAQGNGVLSEEERRALEREVLVQQRELKRARETAAEDMNLRRNEEFARLQRDVAAAIVAVAEEGGYDLVLESGVAFASDRVDITNKVIDRLRLLAAGGTEAKQ